MPLVTNAHGKKVGKSSGSPVWLDKSKTTPFQLYQVGRIMKACAFATFAVICVCVCAAHAGSALAQLENTD